MNKFREKLLTDFEAQLIKVPGIALSDFLEATRSSAEELNTFIDKLIEEEGVSAARRELYWKVNILAVIYKERETGEQMTNEQVVQYAAKNGLLLE